MMAAESPQGQVESERERARARAKEREREFRERERERERESRAQTPAVSLECTTTKIIDHNKTNIRAVEMRYFTTGSVH